MSDLFARLAARYTGTTTATARPHVPPRFGPARRTSADATAAPLPEQQLTTAAVPAPAPLPPRRVDRAESTRASTQPTVTPGRDPAAVNDPQITAAPPTNATMPAAALAPRPTEPARPHSRQPATPVAPAPQPELPPAPPTTRGPVQPESTARPAGPRAVPEPARSPQRTTPPTDRDTGRPRRESARPLVPAAPVTRPVAPAARPTPPARRSATTTTTAPQAPVVRVTIGRVDIHADRPDRATAAVSTPAPPATAPISLGDYLRGRDTS